MPFSEDTPSPPDADTWLLTLYELSHSDVRWAKEQGWRAVNWAFLLFGALVPLAKILLPQVHLMAFATLVFMLAVLAIGYLTELHLFAAESRRRYVEIQRRVMMDSKLSGVQSSGSLYLGHLAVQLVAVDVGAVAVLLALLYLPGFSC